MPWYSQPIPPKSNRHARFPVALADREIPFNPSGGAPAPPPERGFWAPRPGGEWKKVRGRLVYMHARKVPPDYLEPKKKINFFGKECQTTPKPQKQCNADDAENVGTQQQQRTRPPEHRHAAKGLNARALYGFGPGVAAQAAPLPRPQRPPPGGRTMGYDHAHHHNGSLLAGGRYGRQNNAAERGAPPRAQMQYAGYQHHFDGRPAAVPRRAAAPAATATEEEHESLCVIS